MGFNMVKHPDSIDKIFEYFDKLENVYPVYLSHLFFRKLKCPEGCGACCRHKFSMDWFIKCRTPNVELLVRPVEYNGYKATVYSVLPTGTQCVFLDQKGRCKVHYSKPLSCRIEPIKFILSRGCVTISKRKFGRGHMFTRIDGGKGAMCSFAEYDDQMRMADLSVLTHIVQIGEIFHFRLMPIRKLMGHLTANEIVYTDRILL